MNKSKIKYIVLLIISVVGINFLYFLSYRHSYTHLETNANLAEYVDKYIQIEGIPDNLYTLKTSNGGEAGYLFPVKTFTNNLLIYSDTITESTQQVSFRGKLVVSDSVIARDTIINVYSTLPSFSESNSILGTINPEELKNALDLEIQDGAEIYILVQEDISKYTWTPILFSVLLFISGTGVILLFDSRLNTASKE